MVNPQPRPSTSPINKKKSHLLSSFPLVEVNHEISKSIYLRESAKNSKFADDKNNFDIFKTEDIKDEYLPKEDVYIDLDKADDSSEGIVNEAYDKNLDE